MTRFPFVGKETPLSAEDLSLFAASFARTVIFFIPGRRAHIITFIQHPEGILPEFWQEGVKMVKERKTPVFAESGATLFLPVWNEVETVIGVAVIEEVDQSALANCSVPWLLDRSRLISREFCLRRFIYQEPKSGHLTGAHLRDELFFLLEGLGQGQSESSDRFTMILVESYAKARNAEQMLLRVARFATVLSTLLGHDQPLHYLGAGVFGLLLMKRDAEHAGRIGEMILSGLRREGFKKAHLGLRTVCAADDDLSRLTPDLVLAQAWNVLACARKKAPLAQCDHARSAEQPIPALSAPVLSSLRRLWRRENSFAILLIRRDAEQASCPFPQQVKGLVDPAIVLVPLDEREAYIFLPGADAQKAKDWALPLKRSVYERYGYTVSIGVAVFPYYDFTRSDVPLNARKALIHGSFLGPDSVVPFDGVSLNISGDRYYNHGDFVRAVREYRLGLGIDPANVNLINSLGVTYAQMGRYREAIPCFEGVLAIKPDDLMAFFNLGSAYRQEGRLDDATAALEQALIIEGRNLELLVQLGSLYLQQGRNEEAIQVLEMAADLGPEKGAVYRFLGEGYYILGRNREAMTNLTRAIRINPEDPWSLSLLGVLYALEKQGEEIALSFCQQALKFDDTRWEFWHRLGCVYLEVGSLDEAMEAARRSIGLKRDSAEAQYLLAKVQERSGQTREAVQGYKKVMRLDPGHKGAGQALMYIKRDKILKKGGG